MRLILLLPLIFLGCTVGPKKMTYFHQSEPAFCDLKTFLSKEVKIKDEGLERVHTFKLGKVTLAGLGVGDSEVEALATMAQENGAYRPDEKYCVFYINDGNDEAAEAFNHHNVSNPLWSSPEKISSEFDQKLTPLIPGPMLTCLKDHSFAAMGCDGMRHRGPSFFSMVLSYAGCSPEHSVDIVDHVWKVPWYRGKVSKEKRLAIAKKAYEAGQKDEAGRKELRDLLEGK